MLQKIGFPGHLIDLFMQCVSTVQIHILINGELFAVFTPSRGVSHRAIISFPTCHTTFWRSNSGKVGASREIEATRCGLAEDECWCLVYQKECRFWLCALESYKNSVMYWGWTVIPHDQCRTCWSYCSLTELDGNSGFLAMVNCDWQRLFAGCSTDGVVDVNLSTRVNLQMYQLTN